MEDQTKVFERKDLRMSRMSALKNATEMVCALTNVKYYSNDVLSPEFLMAEIQRYADEHIKFIYSGMEEVGSQKSSIPSTSEATTDSPSLTCDKCGKEIAEVVANFCKDRESRFKGKVYCRSCQNDF